MSTIAINTNPAKKDGHGRLGGAGFSGTRDMGSEAEVQTAPEGETAH